MGARAREAGMGPRSLGEGRGVVPKAVAREDGRCLATVAKEARRGGDAAGPSRAGAPAAPAPHGPARPRSASRGSPRPPG